jgi:hypothetical protein
MVCLNSLKDAVMEQAREKGFGTSLDEISVPEKLMLMSTEIMEIAEERRRISQSLDADFYFWQSPPHHPEEPSWACLLTHPDYSSRFKLGVNSHYREEWGDAMQRILHLGGCFGIEFPEADLAHFSFDRFASAESPERFLDFYEMVAGAYQNYRKMPGSPERRRLFERALIDLAHYCVYSSLSDGFSIEEAVLEKIEKNRQRTWRREDYNEKMV